MKKLIDPLTKEEFYPKRRNQKFATAKNRIRFNNNKALAEIDTKKFIDQPFRINHRILMELIQVGETKTYSREYLTGKGYNFSILSHYESYFDKICPALYNFILVDLSSNKQSITIHRKK